jgi:hypothetical protein
MAIKEILDSWSQWLFPVQFLLHKFVKYYTLPSSVRFPLTIYFQKNLSPVTEKRQRGVQEAFEKSHLARVRGFSGA